MGSNDTPISVLSRASTRRMQWSSRNCDDTNTSRPGALNVVQLAASVSVYPRRRSVSGGSDRQGCVTLSVRTDACCERILRPLGSRRRSMSMVVAVSPRADDASEVDAIDVIA